MRDTMRDGSIKRKPTRTASQRQWPGQSNSQQRSDSPQQPMTRTPSPARNDAACAATAATLRLGTPSPAVLSKHSTTNTRLLQRMQPSMRRHTNPLGEHMPGQYDSESITLGSLSARSMHAQDDAPILARSFAQNNTYPAYPRSQGFKSKMKNTVLGFLGDWKELWDIRNEYPSDEHIGSQIVWSKLRGVRSRAENNVEAPSSRDSGYGSPGNSGSSSTRHAPDPQISSPFNFIKNPDTKDTALPSRGPAPAELPAHHHLAPPNAQFTRARAESVNSTMTAGTANTAWTDIMRAQQSPPTQPQTDKGKGKGKSLKIITNIPRGLMTHRPAQDTSYSPAPFNPHRVSDAEAWEHGLDLHRVPTAASSVYSRDVYGNPKHASDAAPPVPEIPGEYLSQPQSQAPVSPWVGRSVFSDVESPISPFVDLGDAKRERGAWA